MHYEAYCHYTITFFPKGPPASFSAEDLSCCGNELCNEGDSCRALASFAADVGRSAVNEAGELSSKSLI